MTNIKTEISRFIGNTELPRWVNYSAVPAVLAGLGVLYFMINSYYNNRTANPRQLEKATGLHHWTESQEVASWSNEGNPNT